MRTRLTNTDWKAKPTTNTVHRIKKKKNLKVQSKIAKLIFIFFLEMYLIIRISLWIGNTEDRDIVSPEHSQEYSIQDCDKVHRHVFVPLENSLNLIISHVKISSHTTTG